MASSQQQQWFLLLVPLAVVFGAPAASCCYTSIFSFGDSLADTGNLYFISLPQSPNCLLPPYGETHFHHPTGRCSDGRLIVDFVAEALGLPYLRPYLGFKNGVVEHGDVKQGINFAVAGATALDRNFFEEKGFVVDETTNYSLKVQLNWFKDFIPSLCNSSSTQGTYLIFTSSHLLDVLGSSLFIVGEIGGNDYGYPLSEFETNPYGDLITYVPHVISVITSTIRELIDLGAETFVVPGSLPLGCNPAYLTVFATENEDEYDQAGCLKWLNKFYEYHNEQLQIELNQLRLLYPLTNIIYADYFGAALQLYKSPEQFGFDGNALKVCCGGGGPYNFNDTSLCSNSEVIACDDPSQYISWDGYHFTEASYGWMAKGLLEGPYTNPKFSFSCFAGETSEDFINYELK